MCDSDAPPGWFANALQTPGAAVPSLVPSIARATMAFVSLRVEVNPALLAWARERSRTERDELVRKFLKLGEWESGDRAQTLICGGKTKRERRDSNPRPPA